MRENFSTEGELCSPLVARVTDYSSLFSISLPISKNNDFFVGDTERENWRTGRSRSVMKCWSRGAIR